MNKSKIFFVGENEKQLTEMVETPYETKIFTRENKIKEHLINELLTLYHKLYRRGINGSVVIDQKNLEHLHVQGYNEFMDERTLYMKVFNIIKGNNVQLSDATIHSQLIYTLINKSLYEKLNDDDYRIRSNESVNFLLNFSQSNTVEIPVLNLPMEADIIDLRFIEFHRLRKEEKNGDWWKWINDFYSKGDISKLYSFARIKVSGDNYVAVEKTEESIHTFLNYLRALLIPIREGSDFQFFVLGDHYQTTSHPYTINSENNRNPAHIQKLGTPIASYTLDKLIENTNTDILMTICAVIENRINHKQNEIVNKYLRGLWWLGEATKPDSVEAKFVKLSISLEFFLGGEPNSNALSNRSIGATIAERAAFIVEEGVEKRIATHKKISQFYDRRSKIVHGTFAQPVSMSEFISYFELVRMIAYKYIYILNNTSNLLELQKFIMQKRYS